MHKLVALIILVLLAASHIGCAQKNETKPAVSTPATSGKPPATKADLPITLTVKSIGICCDKCSASVRAALKKVEGIDGIATDPENRTVTLKAKDVSVASAAWKALRDAGFGGKAAFQGKAPGTFEEVGPTLSASKYDEIVFKGVHACCPGCEKAIKNAIKEGEISFEGAGPQKTVRVKGKQLDFDSISTALWDAGYHGDPTQESKPSPKN